MAKNKKYFTKDKAVNKRINNFLDKFYMRDKGRFFWRERWFSLCSAHQQYNKECKTCNVGMWENVWRTNIEKLVFIISPKIYKWLLKFKKTELINIIEQNEPKKYYRRNQRKN
jgi:hypothetical protein